MKHKYFFLIFLIINCSISSLALSETATSWKEIDRYYKKNKINIFNLQESQIEKFKIYESFPADFINLEDLAKKKEIFFLIAYPLIHKTNENIKMERRQITDIEKKFKNKTINKKDIQELEVLVNKYKLDIGPIDRITFKKLFQRINIIPVSLALGQAIIESGWGQSRFAIEGNALYGQWTYDQQQGLIPEKRDEDKTHAVKKFKELEDSVISYMFNINTHPAYYDFRVVRRLTSALHLTSTAVNYKIQYLAAYAEIGQKYVDQLDLILETNNLKKFDEFN
ncbi:MAG: glucosaminidase domain-containing protein [Proteobacteria bacterium]|nr:glucosaminidase domain-containing protein [Pseudomonadota bacterium]